MLRFKPLRASSAAVHALDVRTKAAVHRVVLKRFVLREWLEEEPDVPLREYSALQILEKERLPSPRPIAADLESEHTDAPAVLMTRVDGGPRFSKTGATRTLTRLAETLVEIHSVAKNHPAFPPYRRWYAEEPKVPPWWSSNSLLWERAFAAVDRGPPEFHPSFIHRDYNPGNLIWVGDRLTGVIDWANACIGPPEADVAHMRNNLVDLGGLELADRFLRSWMDVSSTDSYDPRWDVISAIEYPRETWAPEPYVGPLEEFLRAALDRLG